MRNRRNGLMKFNFITLAIFILVLFACTSSRVKIVPRETPSEKPGFTKPSSGKSYPETISGWKSYQDLVKWVEKDFSFDAGRYKQYEGTLPPPRTSDETFQLKSGIYVDIAFFIKETLNRIDPLYNAQIVVLIIRPYGFNHYVCSFKTGGKLFIMDYGTPYREVTGVHGPYHSLEEYKKFYEKVHPIKRKIEAIVYLH
jgi:hypothetical protein